MEARISPLQARGLYVVQFIILVFGAALVAANSFTEALAALPVFWAMWGLFSQQTDRDTQKLRLYAAQLEAAANAELRSLGEPTLYRFRFAAADYRPRFDEPTYTVPALLFVLELVAAWIAGFWVLWIGDWQWLVVPFGGFFVLSTFGLLSAEANRKNSEVAMRHEIASIASDFYRTVEPACKGE